MKKGFILLIGLVCSFVNYAQSQNLDDLLINYEKEKLAMGNISILQNGKYFYKKSIGYANLEINKKNNSKTKFRIGSISKTFTATIILQLIDEGKLVLHSTLNTFFPEVANSEKITISDMLYHRSGIHNITNDKNFNVWIREPRNRKEMLSKITEHKSVFKPNSKTEYSNSNYILLAYIAENLCEKPFGEILQDKIVKRLKLTNTDFGKEINFSKNEAICYYSENGKWNPIMSYTNLTGTMGAGGIISNAKDVSTFYNALFTGKLISPKSIQLMTRSRDEMGMGISVTEFNGLTVYGHDGAIDGFRSMAVYVPKLKSTIVFTFNASSGSSTQKLIQIFKSYMYTLREKV